MEFSSRKAGLAVGYPLPSLLSPTLDAHMRVGSAEVWESSSLG